MHIGERFKISDQLNLFLIDIQQFTQKQNKHKSNILSLSLQQYLNQLNILGDSKIKQEVQDKEQFNKLIAKVSLDHIMLSFLNQQNDGIKDIIYFLRALYFLSINHLIVFQLIMLTTPSKIYPKNTRPANLLGAIHGIRLSSKQIVPHGLINYLLFPLYQQQWYSQSTDSIIGKLKIVIEQTDRSWLIKSGNILIVAILIEAIIIALFGALAGFSFYNTTLIFVYMGLSVLLILIMVGTLIYGVSKRVPIFQSLMQVINANPNFQKDFDIKYYKRGRVTRFDWIEIYRNEKIRLEQDTQRTNMTPLIKGRVN